MAPHGRRLGATKDVVLPGEQGPALFGDDSGGGLLRGILGRQRVEPVQRGIQLAHCHFVGGDEVGIAGEHEPVLRQNHVAQKHQDALGLGPDLLAVQGEALGLGLSNSAREQEGENADLHDERQHRQDQPFLKQRQPHAHGRAPGKSHDPDGWRTRGRV
jgi:hypothetical protein